MTCRQANGRIEELENAQRRLEDQLQKFRQDVEFRFGEHPGQAQPPAPAAVATAPAAVGDRSARAAQAEALGRVRPQRRCRTRPARRSRSERPRRARRSSVPPRRPPGRRSSSARGSAPPPTTGPLITGSGVAMLDAPREQFNTALQAFQTGQYQQAEDGFKAFMAANSGHRLTPDAIFYIGETYFQRSRPREAAEQYLKVTTDYSKSLAGAGKHGAARPDAGRARQFGAGLRDLRRIRQALSGRDRFGEAARRARGGQGPLLSDAVSAHGEEILSAAEVDALLAPLEAAPSALLAVSGGPDSTALLLMAAEWAARRATTRIAAATVDHGLRPESAAEAASVARLCERLARPAPDACLDRREAVDPGSGARAGGALPAARRTHAGRSGHEQSSTAHHAGDQAETVLFRLMRGSGVAGLSGMAPMSERDGLAIARPLLGVAKSTLVAFAHARGSAFVEDTSNADPRYARPRLRSLIAGLAAEGLDSEGLARLARRAAEADEALERMTDEVEVAARRERTDRRRRRCSRRRSRSSSASSSAGSLRPEGATRAGSGSRRSRRLRSACGRLPREDRRSAPMSAARSRAYRPRGG